MYYYLANNEHCKNISSQFNFIYVVLFTISHWLKATLQKTGPTDTETFVVFFIKSTYMELLRKQQVAINSLRLVDDKPPKMH